MTDVMLALANAGPGRADAFEDWYDSEYVPALCAVEGVLGARCMRAANDLDECPEHPYEFLSICELAPGELASTAGRVAAADLPSTADQSGDTAWWFYEEIGPRVATPAAGAGPFDQMVVLTNANPGTDVEFNRWYDEVHIPDIFNKIGGFVAAHRFRRAALPVNGELEWGYMALYDIPKGTMEHCYSRLRWSRAEREEALAAGREPQVPIAPPMGDHRILWLYRETAAPVPAAGI
ncbi:MAG TPA: hypothetical protein VFW09_21265 [Solirubrobacteraceae bacterium]|nr:hypothetical protein [Solirubrobacteraceae bacterium]